VNALPGRAFLAACTAVLWLAVLSAAPLLTRLESPLGNDSESAAIAPSVTAARNFARRGAFESGGLAVVKPYPIPVLQGIDPSVPPLYAWAIHDLSRASGLDEARSARVLEAAAIFLAAVVYLAAGARIAGPLPGLTGALAVWSLGAGLTQGTAPFDGHAGQLAAAAFLLAGTLAAGRRLAAAVVLTFGGGLIASASGACVPLLLAVPWIVALTSRRPADRRRLALLTAVPLLTWAVWAWALWRLAGLAWSDAVGRIALFDLAVPCAWLLVVVAAARLAWSSPAAALVLAAAASLTPLALLPRKAPAASAAAERLASEVRQRVGFGEAFSSSYGNRAVLEALTERPCVDVNPMAPALAADARAARPPVAWRFVVVPPEGTASDLTACKAEAEHLKARYAFERGSSYLAFDLRRPKGGAESVPAASSPAASGGAVAAAGPIVKIADPAVLRSRTLLLVPLLSAGFAVLALLAAWAFPGRTVKAA
jgi:hypothetical protein